MFTDDKGHQNAYYEKYYESIIICSLVSHQTMWQTCWSKVSRHGLFYGQGINNNHAKSGYIF